MKNILFLFLSALILWGCASGSAVLTGSRRPATNPHSIRILGEYPADYEVVGLVTASSDAGFTASGDIEYATEEIKEQAASLGANAVVLENTGKSTNYGYTGDFFFSSTEHSISGKAIYVRDFSSPKAAKKQKSISEKKRTVVKNSVKAVPTKNSTKATPAVAAQPKKPKRNIYVAVMETVSNGVTQLQENQYLTNVLREEAIKALPSDQNFTIMTRENINMMLPADVSIENCEGSCLVETGKNISADYVAQARIGTFGNSITASIEIYETSSAKLVRSLNVKGSNLEELERVMRNNCSSMFQEVHRLAIEK